MKSIRFEVFAKVEFGQTVGVIANLFHEVLPLIWSEGHIWKGELTIPTSENELQCRFIVYHCDSNSHSHLTLSSPCVKVISTEEGAIRQYNFKNSLQFPITNKKTPAADNCFAEIKETFNKRKIHIAVYAERGSMMFVRGNIWPFQQDQQLSEIQDFKNRSNQSLFHREFLIDMKSDILRYNYIRNLSQLERGVGRYMLFNIDMKKPTAVQYSKFEADNYNPTLCCNHINDKLIVGCFLNCEEDINNLQKKGITAILSLQTEVDMSRKYVNFQEIKRYAKSKGITYVNIPIRDRDPADFIDKVPEALRKLASLSKANHKIYIHCSAGIGRAPQTAILHLVTNEKLSFEEASSQIFLNRPIACPNRDAIITVLQNLDEEYECYI